MEMFWGIFFSHSVSWLVKSSLFREIKSGIWEILWSSFRWSFMDSWNWRSAAHANFRLVMTQPAEAQVISRSRVVVRYWYMHKQPQWQRGSAFSFHFTSWSKILGLDLEGISLVCVLWEFSFIATVFCLHCMLGKANIVHTRVQGGVYFTAGSLSSVLFHNTVNGNFD